MKKFLLSCAALLNVMPLSAVLVRIHANNIKQQPVMVEVYEALEKKAEWDVELEPHWEGRFDVKGGKKRTFEKDLEQGQYQISAYPKDGSRRNPFKQTANFIVSQADMEKETKDIHVTVSDSGVSRQRPLFKGKFGKMPAQAGRLGMKRMRRQPKVQKTPNMKSKKQKPMMKRYKSATQY